MEAETVELGEESTNSTSETSLEDFQYTDYLEYFPEDGESYDFLIDMFKGKKYGWKSRARLVLDIERVHSNFVALKDKLAGVATPAVVGRRAMSPKDHLRKYLESLDSTAMQTLCKDKNVSYTSFMNSNDKSGLIEAILDEMVASI